MTLNTIELPGLVIAELYRNSLLAADEPTPAPAEPSAELRKPAEKPSGKEAAAPPRQTGPSAETYKFLGNNGKKITLVVTSPGIAYLPDDQLAFLAKMLEACKMNMGDVALVNHATSPVVIATLKAQLQPTTLVLFGIEPVAISLPINFPQFKIQPYDGCQYLYTPSLDELVKPSEEGKLFKSKLWVCLKTLFNI